MYLTKQRKQEERITFTSLIMALACQYFVRELVFIYINEWYLIWFGLDDI